MSRREKWLLVAVVAGVALFAADRLIVAPLMASFAAMDDRADALEAQLADARALVNNAGRIERRHRGYLAAGLDADPSAARALLQRRLDAWSRDSGLGLKTQSAGRVVDREGLAEVTVVVSGEGTLASVERFLREVEQAPFPLRVVGCELTKRVDDADRIGVSLTLSTAVATGEPGGPKVVAVGDAEPWRPAGADPDRYAALTRVDIFDRDGPAPQPTRFTDRAPATRPAETQPATQPAPAPADPDGYRVLVGVTIRGGAATAFIEDRNTGGVDRVRAPADFAAGRITGATVDGITYLVDGEPREVMVGEALTGEAAAAGPMTTGTTSASDTSSDRGRPAVPANESEILRRLRERRANQ